MARVRIFLFDNYFVSIVFVHPNLHIVYIYSYCIMGEIKFFFRQYLVILHSLICTRDSGVVTLDDINQITC